VAPCPRARSWCVNVFNAHEKRTLAGPAVGQDDCAVAAYVELGAVIAHLDAEGKAENAGEPLDGSFNIRIGNFGNNGDGRYGAVGEHGNLRAAVRVALASVTIFKMPTLLLNLFNYLLDTKSTHVHIVEHVQHSKVGKEQGKKG
jgi:hypothetical protein